MPCTLRWHRVVFVLGGLGRSLADWDDSHGKYSDFSRTGSNLSELSTGNSALHVINVFDMEKTTNAPSDKQGVQRVLNNMNIGQASDALRALQDNDDKPPVDVAAGNASARNGQHALGEAEKLEITRADVEQEEKDMNEAQADTEIAVAIMLLGSVAFNMTLFYLVNSPDPDIKRYSWDVISATISIFTAILVFSGVQGVWTELVKEYIIDPLRLVEAKQLYIATASAWLHAGIWFVTLHFAVRATVRMFASTEEVKEQQLKCWATLFGNTAGYACVRASVSMQEFDSLKHRHLAAFLVPFTFTASVMFVLFRVSEWVRFKLSPNFGYDEETKAWDKYSEESENDMAGLALSATLVWSVILALSGKPAEAVDARPPSCCIGLFITGGVCLVLTVVATFSLASGCLSCGRQTLHPEFEATYESAPGLDDWRTYCRRWCFILQSTCAMSFAYAWMFLGRYQLANMVSDYNLPIRRDSDVERVFQAILTSFSAFLFIFVLDRIEDMDETGDVADKAIRNVIQALAILVGLSWENAFNGGLEALAEHATGTWGPLALRLAMGLGIGLAIVPAWRLYILKKVIECEEEHHQIHAANQEQRHLAASQTSTSKHGQPAYFNRNVVLVPSVEDSFVDEFGGAQLTMPGVSAEVNLSAGLRTPRVQTFNYVTMGVSTPRVELLSMRTLAKQ